MAAQFFAKRMFRNFAYFGVKGVVWSDERCEGYRQEVKRIGGEFFSFESDKQEDEIRMEVSQWLQEREEYDRMVAPEIDEEVQE